MVWSNPIKDGYSQDPIQGCGPDTKKHWKTRYKVILELDVLEVRVLFWVGNRAQGHWIKCTCGYIYCITECGGADQLSTCPECNGLIGGERHRYVESAKVATEMDGAHYFAWSAQNDLNNYDLGEE
ncbi:NFX1-type zinc finger-containing protein 1 [Homalodisca vitripennis]|nr:NFX1-type zinc finger-containing protein 1 [Homalodisca vitripennis]